MITKERIVDVLKTVNDPELHVDVYALELIYDIKINEGNIWIEMTYTTPMCPYGPQIVEEIKGKLKQLDGVDDVIIDVTFNPPWNPSEELRTMFGI